MLAQQLLTNENSAGGGRGIHGPGGGGEEGSLSQQSGAAGAGGKLRQLKLARRGGEFIQRGQIGTQESVIGGKQLHEVSIGRDQMLEQAACLLDHLGSHLRSELREAAPLLEGIH